MSNPKLVFLSMTVGVVEVRLVLRLIGGGGGYLHSEEGVVIYIRRRGWLSTFAKRVLEMLTHLKTRKLGRKSF